MSEIIKHGGYPEDNICVCEECNCEFAYYDSEVTTEYTTPLEQDFLGGFGVYKWINCPECDAKCTLYCHFEEDVSISTEIKEWFCKKFRKGK